MGKRGEIGLEFAIVVSVLSLPSTNMFRRGKTKDNGVNTIVYIKQFFIIQ